MTRAQIAEAYKLLRAKGAREFGLHAFLASNTLSNEYFPALAKVLFQLAVELKEETGCHITFIDLSGGVGIPYLPDAPENDISAIGEGVRKVYEEVLVPAGMGDVALCSELGRFMAAAAESQRSFCTRLRSRRASPRSKNSPRPSTTAINCLGRDSGAEDAVMERDSVDRKNAMVSISNPTHFVARSVA